jgi:hypothetical protein
LDEGSGAAGETSVRSAGLYVGLEQLALLFLELRILTFRKGNLDNGQRERADEVLLPTFGLENVTSQLGAVNGI